MLETLPDLPVRDLVPGLLAELRQVQDTIRGIDPLASAFTGSDEKLLALLRKERCILQELRRRRTLLRQGIRWTTFTRREASPSYASTSGEIRQRRG